MTEIAKLKQRNKQIVKDFLTKPLTLENLGAVNNLTKESIRLILTANLSYWEYKKRKAEITNLRRAERLEKEGKRKNCIFCNKEFITLYDYRKQKFCSKNCFYNYKRNLISPEEKEAKRKLKAKEYYAKYWKRKKKQTS